MLKKLTDGSKWVVKKIEKGINDEDFVYWLAKPKANFAFTKNKVGFYCSSIDGSINNISLINRIKKLI
jgi:hypothetical protein